MGKKEEYLDVYDENRMRTGKIQKRRDPIKEGDYRLVIHVCIFNSRNQLLIQQRQPFRYKWGGMWDLSVGGCVIAGETSREGARREVLEELGLNLNFNNIRPSFTIHFEKGFDDYYFVKHDCEIDELKLQAEEVKTAKWADQEEVMKLKEENMFIPYWFLDKLWEIKDLNGAF